MSKQVISSNLGYPRLGEKREWKRALENYWNGNTTQEELLAQTKEIRLNNWKKQQDRGIDLIPTGDFSFYDHILDTSLTFGIVPKRFNVAKEDVNTLDTYFSIARGTKDAVASEMTKWFNTNYHYIVPEVENAEPFLAENRPLKYYLEAKEELGIDGKPVIVGPLTFLKLAKDYEENQPTEQSQCECGCGHDHGNGAIEQSEFKKLLDKLVPLYQQILSELADAGAKYIQIDEPVLTGDFDTQELGYLKDTYAKFREAAPDVNLILQTYFESVEDYQVLTELPVDVIGLDFVHDFGENLAAIKEIGLPADKKLAVGIVDGRNIWRSDLTVKLALLEEITAVIPKEQLILQPSNSLQHVPVTKKWEVHLDEVLFDGLSFADEKLDEIAILTKALNDGKESVQEELAESVSKVKALNESPHRNNADVQQAIAGLKDLRNERQSVYADRIKIQHERFELPLLPTTTIGSFPQSPEVRKARAAWLKKEISDQEYETFIEEETARWIKIQEDLEIDVLVHGEFERTDMVEYFGQKLAGFVPTKFGWVQSYGSRAVRPPLVFGDVAFTEAITVKETVYAQSLTDQIVKGMLTAPITIINWSFVRDDIPKNVVANQIGLALRKEVEALEEAGIKIIQVDEPALREGLPLKKKRWQKYLDDSVYSFKLTTTSVKDETQIHTHMCYAEFDDIIQTISDLDADVISIETSRSHGEIISSFEKFDYDKEIGLGVYDIHSPRVPEVSEVVENIERALQVIPAGQFWINPDCGLKTRKEAETIAALEKMVEATKIVREKYEQKIQ